MAIIIKGAFFLLTMMITCIVSISLSSSSREFASLPLNPGFSYISPDVEEGQQLGLAKCGATIVTKVFPCLYDVTSHPKNLPSHCCQLLIELPSCVLPKLLSRVADKILKGINKGVCKAAGSKAAFLGPVPSALGLPPAVNLVENMDIYG